MTQKRLWLSVIAVHLLLFFAMGQHAHLDLKKKSPSKVQVRTYLAKTAPTPKAAPVASRPATPAKKTAPVAKAAPAAPAAPAKKIEKRVASAPAPKPKTAPREEPESEIPEHLVKELQASLARLDQKPITAVDEISHHQAEYDEILVAFLHQALHLPEYGEVKIELTLRSDGTVFNLRVMRSESDKNRVYLEKNLPLLKFPFVGGAQQTFVLTFCNEM